jgi:hypothetical protein
MCTDYLKIGLMFHQKIKNSYGNIGEFKSLEVKEVKQKKLHPSVIKFKEFVKNNPKLIQEVRQGRATWQELYEDWYLLGEDDERWETIGMSKKDNTGLAINKKEAEESNNDKKTDWMSAITGIMKKMDANQFQAHVNNLSQAIGAIQGLLAQFQGSQGGPSQPNQHRDMEGPAHPFTFRKD